MTIVRWDPFGNVTALQNRINRMFDEAFSRSGDLEEGVSKGSWKPPVDIYEIEDGILVKVELPGVSKDNVAVEVKENVLSIRGERRDDADIAEERYYRKERFFGSFFRSFNMPDQIPPDTIKATFKDGILEIKLPKPAVQQQKQVRVNIE